MIAALLQADIVKLNDDELTIISKMFNTRYQTTKDQALFLLNQFNIEMLYITCGKDGAWTISNAEVTTYADTSKLEKKLVDTFGAGDGFSAICILGKLLNWPSETILRRANRFATSICQIRGASPANIDFYGEFLDAWLIKN